MINYRNIFNPSYNYIGLIIIAIIALLIIIIKKDIQASLYQISKSCLIAGIVILVLNLILNFIMEFLIISNYKILIEIITKNIIRNLYFYSIAIIIISSLINIMLKSSIKIEE